MKLSNYIILRDGKKSQCPICHEWFNTMGLSSHFHAKHNPNAKVKIVTRPYTAWNKGLNKNDPRVAKLSRSVSAALKGKPGHIPTEEHRAKTSASMKKAHAEGRAHNIGQSRWNNEPSYPEKFFIRVIENEFEDKNYVRELSFKRFSLDFAWPHKKKCIEIDGEQHERFKDYKERDERKDLALIENSWQVLRISWKNMYAEPKHWIKVAKDFIHD